MSVEPDAPGEPPLARTPRGAAMADPGDRSSWYDVRDGRRHVRPYDFTFTSFAKRRWVGRRVLDVMSEDARSTHSNAPQPTSPR